MVWGREWVCKVGIERQRLGIDLYCHKLHICEELVREAGREGVEPPACITQPLQGATAAASHR